MDSTSTLTYTVNEHFYYNIKNLGNIQIKQQNFTDVNII